MGPTSSSAFRVSDGNARQVGDGNRGGAAAWRSSLSLHCGFSYGAARGPNAKLLALVASNPVRSVRARAEASMDTRLSGVWDVASDRAAPHCVPLRLAPGRGYAEQVWSMQASEMVGRMSFRSTEHHRPNQPLKRTRRTAESCFAGLVSARRLAASRSAFRASDGNAETETEVVLRRGIVALVTSRVLVWRSTGFECEATRPRGVRPSALRSRLG
jgi:hypothetical protein